MYTASTHANWHLLVDRANNEIRERKEAQIQGISVFYTETKLKAISAF